MNKKPKENSDRAITWTMGLFIAAASVLIIFGGIEWRRGHLAFFSGPPQTVQSGGLQSDWGNFGSYLQGTTASLWSLAGFCIIFVAFIAQKQQLSRQDVELQEQRKQFQLQQDGIKRQNFESSFFQLLNLHNQITMAMSDETFGNKHDGRECFTDWYQTMKAIGFEKPVSSLERYLWLYQGREGQLGHYFRNLYHVVKFVKNSDVEDKRRYTSLIRATLSQFELALLFYNGISPYGEKFKPLIEEFGLLENLNLGLLVSEQEDMKFYHEKAFI